MGGGDLNAKKAWHPNTLKNQERVWKAEQAAAEEKKRIAELERERLVERDRAELNKLAKSSQSQTGQSGDDRLHWMYEKPDKKVQQEEYLLGKVIDKNHEQAGKSEADEIPAVSRRVVGSSMLTVSGDTQVDLVRKLREDPLLLVKERERAARAALLNNPVQRARLTELLRKEQKNKKVSKSKKKKKKSEDLDNILAEKLQALGGEKGINLASLLASEDSSSESSDEKSKKKKKKRKKSKSKNVTDSDSEDQRHKSKSQKCLDAKSESKKVVKQRRNSVENESIKSKKDRKHLIENETAKTHLKRNCKNFSEDDQSSDDNDIEESKHKPKYPSKKESKASSTSDKSKRSATDSKNDEPKRKKKHNSNEYNSHESYVKKYRRDSSEDYQSSDDEQSRSRGDRASKTSNYVRGDRYWNQKQNSSEYHSKEDKYATGTSRKDTLSDDRQHKYDHEDRHRDDGYRRDSRNVQEKHKNEKDKQNIEANVSVSDKNWRNTKRSGLSEAEKARKLAEMVAAGAEREKQRERRVADQLAEKETESRPNAHSRSRNVIHQLPESLESRLHSNRHYIQRDQRHMNENFVRR